MTGDADLASSSATVSEAQWAMISSYLFRSACWSGGRSRRVAAGEGEGLGDSGGDSEGDSESSSSCCCDSARTASTAEL